MLAVVLAAAACNRADSDADWYNEGPIMIGEAGGTVTGLNGDVVMTIPEG